MVSRLLPPGWSETTEQASPGSRRRVEAHANAHISDDGIDMLGQLVAGSTLAGCSAQPAVPAVEELVAEDQP